MDGVKKIYLYREIYVLLNLFDPRRPAEDKLPRLRATQLHQKYCKTMSSKSISGAEQWVCANPLHYARIGEEQAFIDDLRDLVK